MYLCKAESKLKLAAHILPDMAEVFIKKSWFVWLKCRACFLISISWLYHIERVPRSRFHPQTYVQRI